MNTQPLPVERIEPTPKMIEAMAVKICREQCPVYNPYERYSPYSDKPRWQCFVADAKKALEKDDLQAVLSAFAAAMQPRDARALEVVEKLLKALERNVSANDSFMAASEQPSNHRTIGMDDYFAIAFPAIESGRDVIATARQYINEMKG